MVRALHTPLSDYYGDASKTAPNDSPEDRASKVFVGGLSPLTAPQILTMYFGRFGSVEAASIKLDPSGVSRGFGFVKLSSPAEVKRVINANPHFLDGRVIDVKRVVQSDDPTCKIFVGGLTLTTTDEMLQKYFSEFGDVLDGSIRRDTTGKPRCFGFVSFTQPQSVEAVLMSGPHIIDGKQVDPKRVYKKVSSDTESRISAPKLFVGGLALQTTQDTLKAYYSKFGNVHDCNVVLDLASGKSRGFGFVRFADQMSLEQAMAGRPHIIDGKQVDPKRALMSLKPENLISSRKIFVGGLKGEHTQNVLRDYFSQFGKVVLVNLPSRGALEGREHRGFGFIDFDDYDAVDRVILHPAHIIAGHNVDVRKGITKEDKMKLDQLRRERDQWDRSSHPWVGGVPTEGYSSANGYVTGSGGPPTGGAPRMKGDDFKAMLLDCDVSETAIESLTKENLLDTAVLSALTMREFEQLPISVGDRKRIELSLKALR